MNTDRVPSFGWGKTYENKNTNVSEQIPKTPQDKVILPSVPQPGADPETISLNADRKESEYMSGLMKPSDGFPCDKR